MELEIRAARPEDRGPIAELIYSSGTDLYDYLFGKRAVEFLAYEFASGNGLAGYRNVTVALLDGQVVATGCFYGREAYQPLTRATLRNYRGCFGTLGAFPVLLRSRHVGSVVRTPKPGELYLSNFGVVGELRSRGIGTRLILHKLAEARRDGYRSFGLDVSVANPRGQALYTKLGLRVTKEKVFSAKASAVSAARKMELIF